MAQVKNPCINDVLRFMTKDDLYEYKLKNSNASLNSQIKYLNEMKNSDYKKGVIFVSPSKEDLAEGKGYIITSYETLFKQHDLLTHWTPNTYWGGTYYDFKNRIIKGHTKDNLKQINCIGFDIDTKNIHPYEIFIACMTENLPLPNVVIETVRGFQAFFVLSSPFYVSINSYKSLDTADRISSNILDSLSKHLPIDKNCNSFGFFRMPKYIVYFDNEAVDTNELINWSKNYEKTNKRKAFKVLNGGFNASALNYTSQEWYYELINVKNIESGYLATSRNNALFTLALAAYASDIKYEDAYNELDQFNSNLINPLSQREFERTLKSAYSGKYSGPKRHYVESLLEMWTNSKSSFKGNPCWYKFKKDRSERVRSHYHEREEDILKILEDEINPDNPFIVGSLTTLAKRFGMAVSTLKEVLKKSSTLVKVVEGKGRAATTKITTRVILLRHMLRNAITNNVQKKKAYRELIKLFNKNENNKTIRILEKIINFEQQIELPGTSPPSTIRLLI